jgi:hypothetical protein
VGRLLLKAGKMLTKDKRNWWIFWNARSEGITCLEHLVLTHPSLPSCDEAYLLLGNLYREDRLWHLAIERYSNLVLYHDKSRFRPEAQAHIPQLRLELLDSPEYDRNGLLMALAELEAWLIRDEKEEWPSGFPTNTLRESVRTSRLDCLRRLSSSDLGIARFYERVENNEGKIYHAERALELAQKANEQPLIAAARALMSTPEVQDS